MTSRAVLWAVGVAVVLLALIGVAASATHYLQEPYNPGFLRFPTVVALHVVLGGFYLALAIVGSPTAGQAATIVVASFAVAFDVRASVAELWIRAARRSGALRAGEVKAA